ncbi:MAG: hypothetical protein KA034_00150 [Candidatus Moranbacteria bacterium]|nr:hypothetical protein [Candidatus Moranbacteria bacterium]
MLIRDRKNIHVIKKKPVSRGDRFFISCLTIGKKEKSMSIQGTDVALRDAALDLASQLANGLLDRHPMDKKAAQDRLQAYINAGDVTPEDIKRTLGAPDDTPVPEIRRGIICLW